MKILKTKFWSYIKAIKKDIKNYLILSLIPSFISISFQSYNIYNFIYI